MINKRNWTLPIILGGIIFFSLLGIFLSSAYFDLNDYNKTIIIYWCVGLFFGSFLCLDLFKRAFYKKPLNNKLEYGFFYPLSLLFTGIVIERSFYPILTFALFLIFWILWAIMRSKNRGTKLSIFNVLIIVWMVLSVTITLGLILGYSETLMSKIYGLSVFLDLRISFSIIIFATLIIIALEKIDFNKIDTKDLLVIEDDKSNPLLIIISHFFILLNFIIRIIWWLGVFIILWGQEIVNEIKRRSNENKNLLFDLAIVTFSILGLYVILIFSQNLITDYYPLNNTIKEIVPFLLTVLLASIILVIIYLIIRFRYLYWVDWKPTIYKNEFIIADRNYRETLGFPILTSGIAGIILYALSNIRSLEFTFFKNFGLFSLLLSIGLILAIVLTFTKLLSKQENINK